MISETKIKNTQALNELVRAYSGYVYTIVSNILGGHMQKEDIEECVSDVFVKLWRSRDLFDDNRKLIPYLASIARNRAKNKLRERNYDLSLEADELVVYDVFNMEKDIEVSQQVEIIRELVEKLSEKEREMFIRFYYNYQPVSYISREMNISEGYLRVKLHRIRKKVKKAFIERGYTCED